MLLIICIYFVVGVELKLLHIPHSVGGNAYNLSCHLKKLGLESESWSLRNNFFNYKSDYVIISDKDNFVIAEIKKFLALRYVFFYDVIFFNFGSTLFRPPLSGSRESLSRFILLSVYTAYTSFLQRVELFFLKILKKKILIQYQGDDARQGDYCKQNFSISIATQVDSGYYSPFSDVLKRKQISLLEKYSHKMYALNPDLLHVLPKGAEFLPYSHISLAEWVPVYTQLQGRPLRIGHAPSHRGVKGTDLIFVAVERLRRSGYEFEFVLIEGLSNDEAKEHYKTIDVLVDQLFAGWYGGLAVECMALGKPVIAFIREADLVFIPEQMKTDLPIINVTPDTIEQVLRRVLEMPREGLFALAKHSREYVEKWHDPVSIAQRIKRDIESIMAQTA